MYKNMEKWQQQNNNVKKLKVKMVFKLKQPHKKSYGIWELKLKRS